MNCVFQLVNGMDGSRSPTVICDRTDLAKKLPGIVPEENRDKVLVLVLMEEKSGEFEFSNAPLLSARNFIAHFGEAENGREILCAAVNHDPTSALCERANGGDRAE